MRKLGRNRRIKFRGAIEDEGIDHRLYAACELFKHQVLVLHFSGESRGLEQTLALPIERAGVARKCRQFRGNRCDFGSGKVGQQPLIDEGHVAAAQDRQLVRLDYAVVLRVKNAVDRSQRDILVAASVACDEV